MLLQLEEPSAWEVSWLTWARRHSPSEDISGRKLFNEDATLPFGAQVAEHLRAFQELTTSGFSAACCKEQLSAHCVLVPQNMEMDVKKTPTDYKYHLKGCVLHHAGTMRFWKFCLHWHKRQMERKTPLSQNRVHSKACTCAGSQPLCFDLNVRVNEKQTHFC